jgi:hypothetical protein
LCGELNDPLFGKSGSEIYSLLQLSFLDPGFDTSKHSLDSIVLYLRYAAGSVYGDTLQPHNLYVYRVDAGAFIGEDSTYYSSRSLPAAVEIGRVENFLPRPNKRDSLFSTTTKAPFLRVPLSADFGKELLGMDSVVLDNDSAFYRALRGLRIAVSANNATPGSMLAFNLNDEAYSRIRLYYHEDTIAKSFDYFFAGANKFTHFVHDYAGSQAGQQIGQVSGNLLYAQATQGLRIKVEIPYVDRLENIAVNKAQLVLTTASVSGDNSLLTSAKQLVLTELQGDTLPVFTSDVLYSLGPGGASGFTRFGGAPEKENINGTLVERYRLTMTHRLQDMVDDTSGNLNKKTVYINVSPQVRIAQRSVFYGPESVNFPLKLELKYTKVQ